MSNLPTTPIKIYLADDDRDDREFFNDALNEIPIATEITEFQDGVDLMDNLFSSTSLPDVLFLDLHMPIMNGFECVSDIRNFNQFSEIKIVVYSTSYRQREVNQLREEGADHYLQKPNSFKQLKNLLFQVVKDLETERNDDPSTDQFIVRGLPN